jgi:hypothetical protein
MVVTVPSLPVFSHRGFHCPFSLIALIAMLTPMQDGRY